MTTSSATESLLHLLKINRRPGRLSNPDPFDLSLVKSPANREVILMTKSDDKSVYDFKAASDEIKNAVALSYEAIKPHLASLPPETVEFYKAAAEELDLDADDETDEEKKAKKDKQDKQDEGEAKAEHEEEEMKKSTKLIDMVKSTLPGVVEAVQGPLLIQIKKHEKTINSLLDARAQDEMRETARTLTVGDGAEPTVEQVEQLTLIHKSMNDTQWNKYLEGQRSQLVLIRKSAVFERRSNPAAAIPGSAFEQLQSIANSIIEKSENKSPDKAFEVACRQNTSLYEQYRSEQARQAVPVGT